jgi:hypothetical protein
MIVTGTRAHGELRRRFLQLPSGFCYHKGEWMESGDDPLLSPTMFLVEQPAGKVLPTHWHRENQFQVVVGGGGTMGRHEIAPIMVHYAGAYSGYGPIIAGPEGVKYFTIRAVFEQGAMMAATQLESMIRGPKRQVSTDRYQPLGEAGLAGLTGARCVDLIEPAADKLAAQVWQLPAGGMHRRSTLREAAASSSWCSRAACAMANRCCANGKRYSSRPTSRRTGCRPATRVRKCCCCRFRRKPTCTTRQPRGSALAAGAPA